MLRYLPLILKNCWRNRRRTVLTIASIGISMCLLGVMMTMYHAFYLSEPQADEAMRLVVRNRVSLTQPVPQAYMSRIKQMPGVQEAMIGNWFGGTYKDNRDPKNMFARFGIEPQKLFTVYGEMKMPEEEKQAWFRDRAGCIIGRDVARNHNLKVGDRLPIIGDIYPGNYEFTIRGIFDWPRNSEVMYFDKEYVEQTLPVGRRGFVGLYYLKIDDPQKGAQISTAIDNEFRNSAAETKTETEQAFSVGFLSLLGNVKMFLIAIGGAVTFTVLLVSANTMAMSVRERVREVGVMKTLGFAQGEILGMILGEAIAISMIGGLIGYTISAGLMRLIAKTPGIGGFLPTLPLIEPSVAAACIGTAALVGVMSALVPAMGASRMPIVQALRTTD
jgi:putative ABC transport system permease protein